MRVCLLSPVYWPEVRRGTERFAHELSTRLVARGHDVTLVCGHRGMRRTVTVEDGVEVVRVGSSPAIERRLERRGWEPHVTHLAFVREEVRRCDPDVVHALYPADAAFAARTGFPLVHSYMGIPHRTALVARRHRLKLTHQAVHAAGATVALSETAREAFARWLGIDARVIAPGADLDVFTPDPAALALEPTIVCAADPGEPRKRVALLVEAFGRVRREHPGARLIVDRRWTGGGDGVEARDLDTPDALVAANREAWVAALPSWGEAFGLVLLEAMACGTPVVGADREAIPEVVSDPAVGRLFEGEDPDALAAALLEAIELSKDPATAAACRAHAERYSWDATTGAYEALYAEVAG